MKYFKRANEWRNSTGSNKLEVETMKAYSYNWWCYFQPIEGTDLYLFNNYYYSSSTSKHQSDLRRLLRSDFGLGYYDDKTVITISISDSLSGDSKNDVTKYIKVLADEIKELKETIKKPRTQKKKNLERIETINAISNKIVKFSEMFGIEPDKTELYYHEAERIMKIGA